MKPNQTEEERLELLEEKIKYRFKDRGLLEEALTHRSFRNESNLPSVLDNERLEFFGDATLDFFVSAKLMREFPHSREGELSRIRASLVDESSLALLASRLGLGSYLRLGRGEEKGGGREKPSLLANAYEALLAALFLDGGAGPVSIMVDQDFTWLLARLQSETVEGDYKTELQELVQARYGTTPTYLLKDTTGPAHQRSFVVTVNVAGESYGQGEGSSKKRAEQAAARSALHSLQEDNRQ